MMRRVLFIILPLILFTVAQPQTGPNKAVSDIVNSIYVADQKSIYKAEMETTTFSSTGPVKSDITVYKNQGSARWDYNTQEFQGSSFIETPTNVIQLDSEKKVAVIQDKITLNEQPNPGNQYNVKLVGKETVAGQQTLVLELNNKKTNQPVKKLWVSPQTNIVMQIREYDENGYLKSSSKVTSIQQNETIDNNLFQIPKDWQVIRQDGLITDLNAINKKAGFTLMQPGYIPEGFTLMGYKMASAGRGKPRVQAIYTNGAQNFSIFQHLGGSSNGRNGRMRGQGRGKGQGNCQITNRFGSDMAIQNYSNIRTVVVGNISQAELQKITENMKN